MGYVIQSIEIADQELGSVALKLDSDRSLTFKYQTWTTIFYSLILSLMFGYNTFIAYNSDDSQQFTIQWQFVVVWFCLILSCLICCIILFFKTKQRQENITLCLVFLRAICFFLICVVFSYALCVLLVIIDLLFVTVRAKSVNAFKSFKWSFVMQLMVIYSPSHLLSTIVYQQNNGLLLYGFQHFYCIIYFVYLLFFCIFSSVVSNQFNNFNYYYDNDHKHEDIVLILLSSNGLVIGLLTYVGVSVLILPYWTYKIVFDKEMVNELASNERSLLQLSRAGDIYGIIEMSKFGKVVDKDMMKEYVKTGIRSHNFRQSVIPYLSFLQQYQIMQYLYENYQQRINCDEILLEKLKLKNKQYKYKLGKDVDALCDFFIYLKSDSILNFCHVMKHYPSFTQLSKNIVNIYGNMQQNKPDKAEEFAQRVVIISLALISNPNFNTNDSIKIIESVSHSDWNSNANASGASQVILSIKQTLKSRYFVNSVFGKWSLKRQSQLLAYLIEHHKIDLSECQSLQKKIKLKYIKRVLSDGSTHAKWLIVVLNNMESSHYSNVFNKSTVESNFELFDMIRQRQTEIASNGLVNVINALISATIRSSTNNENTDSLIKTLNIMFAAMNNNINNRNSPTKDKIKIKNALPTLTVNVSNSISKSRKLKARHSFSKACTDTADWLKVYVTQNEYHSEIFEKWSPMMQFEMMVYWHQRFNIIPNDKTFNSFLKQVDQLNIENILDKETKNNDDDALLLHNKRMYINQQEWDVFMEHVIQPRRLSMLYNQTQWKSIFLKFLDFIEHAPLDHAGWPWNAYDWKGNAGTMGIAYPLNLSGFSTDMINEILRVTEDREMAMDQIYSYQINEEWITPDLNSWNYFMMMQLPQIKEIENKEIISMTMNNGNEIVFIAKGHLPSVVIFDTQTNYIQESTFIDNFASFAITPVNPNIFKASNYIFNDSNNPNHTMSNASDRCFLVLFDSARIALYDNSSKTPKICELNTSYNNDNKQDKNIHDYGACIASSKYTNKLILANNDEIAVFTHEINIKLLNGSNTLIDSKDEKNESDHDHDDDTAIDSDTNDSRRKYEYTLQLSHQHSCIFENNNSTDTAYGQRKRSQILFVPQTDEKEFVVFDWSKGQYSNFAASLKWFSCDLENDSYKIQTEIEKSKLFQQINPNIKLGVDGILDDFGFIMYENFLIVFGGDTNESLLNQIFYFDFNQMEWYKSQIVLPQEASNVCVNIIDSMGDWIYVFHKQFAVLYNAKAIIRK